MQNIKSLNYKLYRDNLAYDLKTITKTDSKKLLKKERYTPQYQISKLIKTSIYKKLRDILSTNDKLDMLKKENELINEEKQLVSKIKNDVSIFAILDIRLKEDKIFILKLLKGTDLFFSKYFPKKFLKDKQFILNAIAIEPLVLTEIDNSLKSDLDIILETNQFDNDYLAYLNIKQYREILLKKNISIKKFNLLTSKSSRMEN